MKVDFDSNGVLIISPESPMEEYCLSLWVKENISPPQYNVKLMQDIRSIDTSKMLIKTRMD